MRSFCLYRVTLGDYPHVRVVDEVILGLRKGFQRAGLGLPLVYEPGAIPRGRTPIVLLPHLLMDRDLAALPSDAILFNMEQVSQDMPFVTKGYITTLKSFQVWDIDDRNILALRGLGVRDIDLCQIGYVPELTRINPAPVKDIDVLFYGSINDRRRHVLRQLHDKGLKVALQFNAYGQQRDQIIARSKVVMNIHSYAAKVFEIVRISYLWANQVCVASEYSPGVSDQLREGMLEASYDELAEAVWDLLQDALKREQIAETGFHRFSAIRQEHVLPGCVLAETRSESEIA